MKSTQSSKSHETPKVRQNKRICKGDKVFVTAGNERGQVGTVLSHRGDRVIVQGLNMRKKAVKKSQQNPSGGFIDREATMHVSNVRIFVADNKPVKLKVKTDDKGQRQLCYQDGNQEVVYRPIKKRTT